MRLGSLTSRPALNGTQAVLVARVAAVSRLLPSLGAARWSVRAGTEVRSIKPSCRLPAAANPNPSPNPNPEPNPNPNPTQVLSIKESCLLPAAVLAVADASEFAAQHEAALVKGRVRVTLNPNLNTNPNPNPNPNANPNPNQAAALSLQALTPHLPLTLI